MKKANKILIIALALSMANPAHARVVERADSIADTRITAVWHEIKVVAVKTWHDLRNQFLGDSEVSSEPKKAPAVMAQTPTESVEAPKEEAQLPNSQLAPDPALIAASAQVVAPQIEVQNQGQTQLAEIIKQTRATVSNKSPVQVSSPGRAGTSVLPKTKIGVPTFALTKKETKKTK
ncbi:MAG: hypothetical protein KDD38_10810, partial [Bdellovibrionales bacterium]|nr:hypothetical protein [Bdellovibrionales bacterium]